MTDSTDIKKVPASAGTKEAEPSASPKGLPKGGLDQWQEAALAGYYYDRELETQKFQNRLSEQTIKQLIQRDKANKQQIRDLQLEKKYEAEKTSLNMEIAEIETKGAREETEIAEMETEAAREETETVRKDGVSATI